MITNNNKSTTKLNGRFECGSRQREGGEWERGEDFRMARNTKWQGNIWNIWNMIEQVTCIRTSPLIPPPSRERQLIIWSLCSDGIAEILDSARPCIKSLITVISLKELIYCYIFNGILLKKRKTFECIQIRARLTLQNDRGNTINLHIYGQYVILKYFLFTLRPPTI